MFLGDIQLSAGASIRKDEGVEFCFAGVSTLELHKAETASYRLNIEQTQPRLYTVLRPAERVDEMPSVHLVTAAPDEAEAYAEGDEWLIGAVTMPQSLCALLAAFINEHHVEAAPRNGPRARHRSRAIGPKPGASP